MEARKCVTPLLLLLLVLRFAVGQPLLEEVEFQALRDAAAVNHVSLAHGGAWLDVDEDGDLDFVLSGDPAKGIHIQWLMNLARGKGFQARALDSYVENLPDASVSLDPASRVAVGLDASTVRDSSMKRCGHFLWESIGDPTRLYCWLRVQGAYSSVTLTRRRFLAANYACTAPQRKLTIQTRRTGTKNETE